MIELMKPKLTFTQSEIQDGDIICFQVEISDKESVSATTPFHSEALTHLHRVHDQENQGLYSNPTQYYDFLQNRVMITFRPKYDEVDQDHPEFNQVLSKKQNYDVVRTSRFSCPRDSWIAHCRDATIHRCPTRSAST